MEDILRAPLATIAAALREQKLSATELTTAAIEAHDQRGAALGAYKHFDAEGALAAAARADGQLGGAGPSPPFCGIPVSVKDLYGVDGLPTYAGTARRLPDRWSTDAWLVERLRRLGAVFTGKTHTVELAYGGVGINPHWGTPRNPWDRDVHRIPGGSSCGAGVSLWEGSALVALGSDTGGSVRIPAGMTGTVGQRTTRGRWPTTGVVQLSSTLDTVGALTRTVEDQAYFFASVDPGHGDPAAFLAELAEAERPVRVAVPRCRIWDDCQADLADTIHEALDELSGAGWLRSDVDGHLLDEGFQLYMNGGIAGAECRSFLARELPDWIDILHPTVGRRLESALTPDDPAYGRALEEHRRLCAAADTLFREATVLALPTTLLTPPPVADLEDLDRYLDVNVATLRPTCPASLLGLCAITLPVGLDGSGMPVGLQLVAPGGADERLLAVALAAERALGTARDRLGEPPM